MTFPAVAVRLATAYLVGMLLGATGAIPDLKTTQRANALSAAAAR